jgi:hypothetical protein
VKVDKDIERLSKNIGGKGRGEVVRGVNCAKSTKYLFCHECDYTCEPTWHMSPERKGFSKNKFLTFSLSARASSAAAAVG